MKREPLSWLLLERYALGELNERERLEVEARLAESEVDRACLAQIRADTSELPPLAGTEERPTQVRAVTTLPMRRRWLPWSLGLCAAAAGLLVMLRRESFPASDAALDQGVKGSDVTLRLISDQQGADPQQFSAGERFKLEVTCPPRLSAALHVLVFQAGEVFEPMPSGPVACGNGVPWPGAFALDGEDAAEVCVTWAPRLDSVKSASDLGPARTCARLAPR